METRGISIVVTTWNNASSIRPCLDSLRAVTARETVLCDCGSSDETVKIITKEYTDLAVISRDCRLSLAQARNLGLKHTTAPLILFVEGDWLMDPASLRVLEEKLRFSAELAIAVPRYEDGDGGTQIGHNVRRFPTTAALCAELLLIHKLLRDCRASRLYRMLDFDHERDLIVDHASGAVVLARRRALLEVGGYDESYAPAWMEDVDLSQRLANLGWRTMFCARATTRHIGRETTRHFLIEDRYDDFYRSVLRYSCRHLGPSWQLVRFSLILGMFARITFAYLFPPALRVRLLRRYRIYNSDQALHGYRRMYLRAFKAALRTTNA